MKNNFKYVILFVGAPLVYILVKVIFTVSEAREVYAIISAWWFSLFLFSFLKFEGADWKSVAIICFVHAVFSHIFEYRDFDWNLSMIYIILGAFVMLHYSSYILYLLLNKLYNLFQNNNDKYL